MVPGPPSWDPEANTFSFFLHKRGREGVLCTRERASSYGCHVRDPQPTAPRSFRYSR